MPEEFEGGYQTTEEPVTQEPTTQESTQTEPSSPQESNYFEVKYNKEPVRVSYDEAPDYIQKGMNYDKVSQRVSEYESHLERVARVAGYESHDQMLAQLDVIEQQQEQQRYTDAGIDPDMFNQLLESHPDIQFAREQRAKQQEQEQFQEQATELFSEFPNLKPEDIKPEVFQMQQERGISLLDAYLRYNYKNLSQQSEQQAIQKIQSNQLTSTGPLNGGDVSHKTSVSSMSSDDFKALQDRVLRGERVQF